MAFPPGNLRFSIKDALISRKLFIFLFLSISALHAAFVDTTLFGNGGPGPYSIGTSCPDTASLTITLPGSGGVPPWTIIPDRNELLFSQPIDSGVPIHVRFRTLFYGVPKIFSLYSKTYLDPKDTAMAFADTAKFAGLSLVPREENLSVSGYKSVAVSVGSFGQVNLEQGLDVRIGGEIRPQTSVSAHLSDQGSSLDGATREISDFDMIYIALDNPSYHAVAGDQYVAWPFQGLLSGRKKIQRALGKLFPAIDPVFRWGVRRARRRQFRHRDQTGTHRHAGTLLSHR